MDSLPNNIQFEEDDPAPNPYVLPQEESPLRRGLNIIEAWLAAIFGTLMSVFFVIMYLAATNLINAAGASELLIAVLLLTCAALFQGPFLFRLWAATLKRELPIGPAVARRTNPRLAVVRSLSSLWWAAHILIAMLVVVAGEVEMFKGGNRPGMWFVTGVLFGMTVCCNVFVALLVKSAWNRDSAVETFWRWRLVVDISLTGIALLIAKGV